MSQRKDQNRVPSLAVGKDCIILVPWVLELGVRYWGLLQEGRCLYFLVLSLRLIYYSFHFLC